MSMKARSILAIVLIVCFLATSSLFPAGVQASDDSSGIDVWTVDSLDKVFRTTEKPENASKEIRIYAAKNEKRAGQIAIRSQKDVSNVSIEAGNLVTTGGSIAVKATFIDFIHLPVHTYDLAEGHQLDDADKSMYFPDRITKDSTCSNLKAGTTLPVWYSVNVPADAVAGEYTGTVTIKLDDVTEIVNVFVKVYDVTLPDTSESTYKVDNWFGALSNDINACEALNCSMV